MEIYELNDQYLYYDETYYHDCNRKYMKSRAIEKYSDTHAHALPAVGMNGCSYCLMIVHSVPLGTQAIQSLQTGPVPCYISGATRPIVKRAAETNNDSLLQSCFTVMSIVGNIEKDLFPSQK